MSVIGDTQAKAVQPAVSALPLGMTTYAELIDATSAVNTKLYSGKKSGAMYVYEVSAGVMQVVVASGSEPTDTWTKLSDNTAAAPIVLSTTTEIGATYDQAEVVAQLNLIEAKINEVIGLMVASTITPA